MLEFDIAPVGMSSGLRYLQGISRGAEPGGGTALREIAPKVVEEAKQNAPVDSGALRDSIGWKPTKNGFTIYTDLTGDRSDYDYYQEFGFYHIHAGRWVPGKFYITQAVYSYVTNETDNKIFDKIQERAKIGAVFGTALALAENMFRIGNISAFDTFLLTSMGNLALTR